MSAIFTGRCSAARSWLLGSIKLIAIVKVDGAAEGLDDYLATGGDTDLVRIFEALLRPENW